MVLSTNAVVGSEERGWRWARYQFDDGVPNSLPAIQLFHLRLAHLAV